MNTLENKKMLWDTLVEQQKFNKYISVEKTQHMFEVAIQEMDAMEATVDYKNKSFLDGWMARLEVESTKHREKEFEERVNQKQYKQPPSVTELAEIKKLLYQILERLE